MAASEETRENRKAAAAVSRIIGANMRRFRLPSRFRTQEQMAEALGVGHKMYNRYENGNANVPTFVVLRFSRLFGISVDELFQDPDAVARPKNDVEISDSSLTVEGLQIARHAITEAMELMMRDKGKVSALQKRSRMNAGDSRTR